MTHACSCCSVTHSSHMGLQVHTTTSEVTGARTGRHQWAQTEFQPHIVDFSQHPMGWIFTLPFYQMFREAPQLVQDHAAEFT